MRVTSRTDQEIAPDVPAAVNFELALFDTDGSFSLAQPTRLTATKAGIYQITANVLYSTDPTGKRGLLLFLNGTLVIGSVVFDGGAAEPADAVEVTTLYQLAVGDYVEALAFHTATAPLTVQALAETSPEFMMVRVA